MTAPLSAEAYDHIRADVHTAVLEAQYHDPTVTLQILFRLLDNLGELAIDPWPVVRSWSLAEGQDQPPVQSWATWLLRDVQLRATSKVPYGEPREPEYLEHDVLDADERGGR